MIGRLIQSLLLILTCFITFVSCTKKVAIPSIQERIEMIEIEDIYVKDSVRNHFQWISDDSGFASYSQLVEAELAKRHKCSVIIIRVAPNSGVYDSFTVFGSNATKKLHYFRFAENKNTRKIANGTIKPCLDASDFSTRINPSSRHPYVTFVLLSESSQTQQFVFYDIKPPTVILDILDEAEKQFPK